MTDHAHSPIRLAIVGSTASGKSALALAACQSRPGFEVVSVDAMQVYRGMDIGTAKPTPAERHDVRHHLIDLVPHTDEFALADFQRAGVPVEADLATRGVMGIAVGGTGLYLRSIVDRLSLPGQWPTVRQTLESEPDTEVLHRRLAELDPLAATRMERTNRRRIVRALEVTIGSSRPFSSFGPGLDHYPDHGVVQIGLRWTRAVLTARIDERVRMMIAGGFVDEVGELLANGPLSRTASQALGYREIAAHLDGRRSLDEAVEDTVLHTRQFAVRQERWFRRDPRIRWIDVVNDPVAEGLATVLEALDR